MEKKNFIPLIILLAFLMGAPGAVAGIPLAPNIPADRIKSIHPFEFNLDSIFLAQNEPAASESESRSSNANKDQAPNSATVDREESGQNSDAAETKPIKPFKPSEEIAAEQAVDFPVDI